MKKLIIGCFLISVTLGLTAQDKIRISGNVKEKETGEDLIGATVLVQELGTGNISNAYGFYSFSVDPGEYTLVVSFIGFEKEVRKVSIKNDTTINFELAYETELLEEIVVTSEAENTNVSTNEMSVAKISAATVKRIPAVLGEPDVIRSIQLLPGITSVGDGATGFNVRGGSADQNLILLDEGIIFNSAHLLGLYSAINPDAVKDVKVYKGGIPARYGGRLSSVLDVRQKEGNMKKLEGEGGISLISARALLEGPIVKDKGSFLVTARRSYGDALLRLFGDDNTAYFYDLNLKSNYQINENNRLFLSGYFGRDEVNLGGIFGNGWGNATGTLRWNKVFSPRLFANFSAVYSNYDYFIDNLATGTESRVTSDIFNYNLKADFTYYLQGENRLEFGVDQQWHEFRPAAITPLEGSPIIPTTIDNKFANEQGAYLSYLGESGNFQWNVGARVSRFARTGEQDLPIYENDQPVVYNQTLGRYEEGRVIGTNQYGSGDNIRDFVNFEPRIGLTYTINDEQSIKASYNRMYQYLHLISNTTAPTPLDVWAPSGEFIDPQSADQFALGYFRNFKDNMFEASIEVYYKDMQNLVDYVDGADIVANNQIETQILSGEGRSYGAELYIKKNRGRFTGWLSYTLSRSERRVTGLTENDPGINNGDWYAANFDKLHDLSITGIYELDDRWSLSGNFILASGLPATFTEGRYQYAGLVVPHFGARNQNQLPTFHRLDISATMKRKPKNGKERNSEWVFGLYNVYNRLNANSIYFTENSDVAGQTQAFQTSLFGITPNITYNFKF